MPREVLVAGVGVRPATAAEEADADAREAAANARRSALDAVAHVHNRSIDLVKELTTEGSIETTLWEIADILEDELVATPGSKLEALKNKVNELKTRHPDP